MKGYVLPSFGLFSTQSATSFGRIARYTSSLADALSRKGPKNLTKLIYRTHLYSWIRTAYKAFVAQFHLILGFYSHIKLYQIAKIFKLKIECF